MNGFYEALKGFTDLPISILSLVFGFVLLRQKSSWSPFFFLLSFSALLGTAAHTLNLSSAVNDIVWTVLYLLLFECVRRFTTLFCGYIKGSPIKEHYLMYLSKAVFYIVTVVVKINFTHIDIYVFTAFAGICIIRIIIYAIIKKRFPKRAKILVLLLIPPVLLQFFDKLIPFAVVFEHIFILLEIVVAYLIAKDMQNGVCSEEQ